MNSKVFSLAEGFVDAAYMRQAAESRRHRERLFQSLLAQRQMPEEGWDDLTIQLFLSELAVMDTNNFIGNVGAGEREARVFCTLVRNRHFGLSHGIGRSGEISAVQPKAAGSSLLYKLTSLLALHAIRLAGIPDTKACLVVPTATGMAHVLTFLALKTKRPQAKYIIWPRMDQQTCFKAICTAGFEPIVIENLIEGDQVRTDVPAIRDAIQRVGADAVLCVLTTSSCFAPRAPDRVDEVAKVCKELNVAHVINNAYGLQCQSTCKLITRAARIGRVDAFVQSTDKNFLVPVGGAIVASFDPALIEVVSKSYPGRASVSPILDLFITLLSMGVSKWQQLLKQREETMEYFRAQLSSLAAKHGERLLDTTNNPISLAMTVDQFGSGKQGPSYLGSMMFNRNCSGLRTVPKDATKTINGIKFVGYGAHVNKYPHHYFSAACGIGMTKEDVDMFVSRLEKTLVDFRKQTNKPASEPSNESEETKIPAPVGGSTLVNASSAATPSVSSSIPPTSGATPSPAATLKQASAAPQSNSSASSGGKKGPHNASPQ